MALCAECGSTISKVPAWLSDVKVTFVCEACRNKHPRQWASPEVDLLAEEDEDEVEAKEPIEVGLEVLEAGTGDADEEDEEGFGGLELEPESE